MEKIKKLNVKIKIAMGCVIVLLILVLGSFAFYHNGIKAVSSKDKEVIVTIPKGSSGSNILEILNKKDLLKSPMCAKIYLKLNSYDFKSNVYILNKNMDLEEIMTILEGNDKEHISNTKITVLDGQTIPEYAKIIAKQTGIDENKILEKWTDQAYLKKLIKKYWFLTDDILSDGIYYPLEGYLAPETYFLTQEDNIESITKMMLDQMEKHLQKYKTHIESFKVGNQTLSIHQFMTLSSIVQRESPTNSQDQQLIAGVLINRLNKQMPLQCDVTVNYGNQVVKIAVTHNDLSNDTKYNTYHWNAIGKQKRDHKQKQIVKERESVFINQNKKNIPDIVCERILENPKYERPQKSCCILDAKYYGWDYEKEAYYLPRNLDIYKQFFYQEQFQRIYEKENETNVGVYNFLVLPDYLGDTKDTKWGIIRQCAVIEFDYHQNQKIAVLQVDIEKLVDFIYSGLDMKEDVLSVFLGNNLKF